VVVLEANLALGYFESLGLFYFFADPVGSAI